MKLVTASLERGFFATTRPFTAWLIRRGVRPNNITTVGAAVVVASAVAMGFGMLRTGAGLLLFSGVVDTFDGQVARETGQTSVFGAFYDSTLDRMGDGVTFMGIGAWFLTAPDVAAPVFGAMMCMAAILASTLVSYARARAEGLGLECKVGLVQRAERLLGIGVPVLFFGGGPQGLLLHVLVALLALGSMITVVQRFVYVHQITREAGVRRPAT